MNNYIFGLRFYVGRWMVHAGLRLMPKGRAKEELLDLMWHWRRQVDDNRVQHQRGQPQ